MKKEDQILLNKLKNLVQLENRTGAEILRLLSEVEKKSLYAELKYSSLFHYLCKELRHSEAAAMRRINALRMMKEFPFVVKKIEEGKLNLSNLSKAHQSFKKSDLSIVQKEEILEKIEGLGVRETEKVLFESLGHDSIEKKEKVRAVSSTQKSVSFILSDDELKLIEELKSRLNRGRRLEIKEVLMDLAEEKLEKLKTLEAKTLRKASPAQKVNLKRRSPGLALKRELLSRAKHQCEHPGCDERSMLEIHHSKPWIDGGETSANNLVVLCKGHHKRETYLQFGFF